MTAFVIVSTVNMIPFCHKYDHLWQKKQRQFWLNLKIELETIPTCCTVVCVSSVLFLFSRPHPNYLLTSPAWNTIFYLIFCFVHLTAFSLCTMSYEIILLSISNASFRGQTQKLLLFIFPFLSTRSISLSRVLGRWRRELDSVCFEAICWYLATYWGKILSHWLSFQEYVPGQSKVRSEIFLT